jgi:hypothetical protein
VIDLVTVATARGPVSALRVVDNALLFLDRDLCLLLDRLLRVL